MSSHVQDSRIIILRTATICLRSPQLGRMRKTGLNYNKGDVG